MLLRWMHAPYFLEDYGRLTRKFCMIVNKTHEFKKNGKWHKLTPMLEKLMEGTRNYGFPSACNNKNMICLFEDFLQE